MDQVLHDPWLNSLADAVVLSSVAAWIYILSRWWRHGEVMPQEPRRPVPWGPPAAILAVAFVLLAVVNAWVSSAAADIGPEPSTARTVSHIVSSIAFQLFAAGAFFAVIAVVYGVTADDLALPRSARDLLRDIAVGFAACGAALLPVRIIQGLLHWQMGRQNELSQHPLIEVLTSGGGINIGIMTLACLSAVVVAPIVEEVTFRLLLQGWLEKWEDSNPQQPIVEASAIDDSRNQEIETIDVPGDDLPLARISPQNGALGLPYGWLPIFVSSFLFGIAHFGYGPEPIPLFFFGVFLGYVYQRTHRILPCIVAHGLFNLVSMLALWRIIVIQAIEPGG